MKLKLALSLCLLSIIVIFCTILTLKVEANIFEPQWGEFCPPNYQNAVFRKGQKPGMYT